MRPVKYKGTQFDKQSVSYLSSSPPFIHKHIHMNIDKVVVFDFNVGVTLHVGF